MQHSVNIIGAGLAGLSAAITLAREGIRVNLVSSQQSERAQSVLAEGGINAALDTMGEQDSVAEHFADTMRGGCYLQSEEEIHYLTEQAPEVVRELRRLGVPFAAKDGKLILRSFGGQKKRRTAYAKSSTGKMLMTALIDEARRYEVQGLITRYPHHELYDMEISAGKLQAVLVRDSYTGTGLRFSGTSILCTGGLNGFFPGMTTGTTQNTGSAAAIAFHNGVECSNLEFIQYHPTTVQITGKRMLISEAARGEGGRLYLMRSGAPWYFMEEKYPSLGNLMPRDVVSREMVLCSREAGVSGSAMLDMTGLDPEVFSGKLSDMRQEIMDYMGIDPQKEPVPVGPGIHYFMGGIRVDGQHRTSVEGLYAAGEAACRYHGANRLGGNSMLGALVGGRAAALNALKEAGTAECTPLGMVEPVTCDPAVTKELSEILLGGLSIIRTEEEMTEAKERLIALMDGVEKPLDEMRCRLGLAMLESALERRESRGAHYRTDYPGIEEDFRANSVVKWDGQDGLSVRFVPVQPEK